MGWSQLLFGAMAKILIAEDDTRVVQTVQDILTFQHHVVDVAKDGAEAIELLRYSDYELLILDVDMPEKSGFDICRSYRSGGGKAPVLFLTGKSQIHDKEEGFVSGADDYLTKPFHMKELQLRVDALLRRPVELVSRVLELNSLRLDLNSRVLATTDGGNETTLSAQECSVMELLMKRAGDYFSTEELLRKAWPADTDRSIDTVRSCLRHIRRKLSSLKADHLLESSYGLGYRLTK